MFGIKVLSSADIENFQKGVEVFRPLLCRLTPNTVLLPRRGMLIKLLRKDLPIELMFIPVATQLEMIEHVSWPTGIGLTIETI